jgi:gliding motility associated protien GldN
METKEFFMKKVNIILALFVLLSLGISTVLMAQSSGKKKKRKKSKSAQIATADSINAERTRDSLSRVAISTPVAEPIDTSHQLTDGLVADTSFLSMSNIELDTTRPVDGFYKMALLRGAKPFAFPKENKFNIKFYKRIWRTIDLTDSVNRIFSMPGQTLMAMIMEGIKAQKIVAYYDEAFTKALTYDKVIRVLSDSTIIPDLDSVTGDQIGSHSMFVPFNPDSVTRLEIKEDIYVDKVRGRLITQIIGMSPLKKVKGSAGDVLGEQHPFYLYFPQCRNVFASKEAFDTQRDIYDVSYDDLFIQRNFNSVIVKESNPGDLRIRDKYPNDEPRQKQEADRIEKEIREYKKRLWKY